MTSASKHKLAFLQAAATIAIVASSTAAQAQGPAGQPVSTTPTAPAAAENTTATGPNSTLGNIDEITVTARRRSERLQDVPIAVTVLNSQEIARGGVQSIGDIANLTPSVNYDNALSLGRNFLTIRGIGQSIMGPPPAAIVVDGVQQILPLQFNVDEFDLQQVEVLKGPQGAIYGRNAIAGALNFTTLKPSDEFQAHVLGSYARGDEWQAKASVSGPVIPGLLYLLGGVSYDDRRGQVRDITTGTYSDKFRDWTGRIRAVLTPAPNVEVDIKYTHSDTHGHDPNYLLSSSGNPSISSDPLVADRVGRNPRVLNDLSGKLNWTSDFAVTTLTLAYIQVNQLLFEDLDYASYDFLTAQQTERARGFSQELRFASPNGGRLHWLAGAYHVRSRDIVGTTIFVDPFYLGAAPAPTSSDVPLVSSTDHNYDETWSGFASLSYDLSSHLTLEGAIRYDRDRVRQASADGSTRSTPFSQWQPKGTITWKPSSNITVYGSVGRGFRSGSFNASDATFGNAVVKAEVATTYEVGAKTQFLDRRVTLNGAIYQTDLRNGQFYLFDAAAGTNVQINIDKTRIRGFELEGSAQIVKGFSITASLGYTDPKVRAFTPPPGFRGSLSGYIGNMPPRIAKITADLGLDYEIPLNERLTMFFKPQYRFTDHYFWDLENHYRRPTYNIVDIRAGVRAPDDKWALTGFVKNALNEKVTSDYEPFVDSGHPSGKDVYYPPVGSIYGVEVTYRF